MNEYVRFVRFAWWSARLDLCDRLPGQTCWIHGYSWELGPVPDRWWRLFGWQ